MEFTNQILNQCHDLTTKLPLILLYFSFIISFLFWGFLLVKESRKKLLWILFYTFLTTGIVFAILYWMPITITQNIRNWSF